MVFFGSREDFFSGGGSCYRERKAVTEEGISSFWVRVRTGEEVIFFFWSFLEGCFLEEKNLDSFAEEYPFSLRGRLVAAVGQREKFLRALLSWRGYELQFGEKKSEFERGSRESF